MKLKFWQKTYLAILALFLVCLCSVTYATYRVAYQQSYDSYLEEQLGTQHYLLESLAQDMVALNARRPEAMLALHQYYAQQQASGGLYFEVYTDGALTFDATPKEYLATGERPECSVSDGNRTYLVRSTSAGRRLFSATALSDTLSGTVVVFNAEIESFYQTWEQMARLFLVATGGVSFLFAAVLYLVLSQLYRPLAAVTHTANALATGDLSARAVVQRKDEFGTLAQSMNGMAQTLETQITTLEQATQEKQQLLDHLAHEIRTPLASISGWAETIRNASLSEPEQAEAIDIILFESNRIVSLSKQLLQLSVLRHDKPDFAPVDLACLLTRVETALTPKAAQKNVQLEQQLLGAPEKASILPCTYIIAGDETLLESLLLNLTDNAIKACRAGGQVRFALQTLPQGAVQVSITDTGCGMPPETLQNIGTPFYRADKARSRSEGGAGLGVSLCMAIANYHGATLAYQSRVEKGTVCTITFTTSTQLEDTLEKNGC